MARITIDDLPAAPELPPEQEELIQGAGLKSFKPGIESLEGRELYAANLAGALAPELLAPAKAAALDSAPVQQHLPVNQIQQAGPAAESDVVGSLTHAAPSPEMDAALWASPSSAAGLAANGLDAGLGARQMGQQAVAGTDVDRYGDVTVKTTDGSQVFRYVGGVWKQVASIQQMREGFWRKDSFAEDGTRIRDTLRLRPDGGWDHVSRTVIAGGKMTHTVYHAAAHYMSSGLLWYSKDVQQTWVYSISADGRSQDLLTYELIPDGSAYYANRWTKGAGWNVYNGGHATVDGNPPAGQYLSYLGDFLADKTVAAPPGMTRTEELKDGELVETFRTSDGALSVTFAHGGRDRVSPIVQTRVVAYDKVGGEGKVIAFNRFSGVLWVEESWGTDGAYTKDVWTKREHGATGSDDHVSRTVVRNGEMTVTGFNLKGFVYLKGGDTYPATTVTWTYSVDENNRVKNLLRYDARVLVGHNIFTGDPYVVSATWDLRTGGKWEHTGKRSDRIEERWQAPPASIPDGRDWSGWAS